MLMSFASFLMVEFAPAFDIVVEGVRHIVWIGQLKTENQIGGCNQSARAFGHVVLVPRREIHAAAAVANRHVQGLGELDQPVDAGLRARVAIGDDHRILCVDEHLSDFCQRVLVAGDRRHARQFRDRRLAVRRQRVVLHLAIEDQERRRHRRRHADLVGADGGVGEVLERGRRVVPFDVVAHHRGRILHRMRPDRGAATLGCIERIAGHDVDRHAIAPGIVDRHRGVLQADGPVREDQHRLAFDLGIAVRHGDRRFLVRAGVPFQIRIVDQRFVQPAEAGTRVGGDLGDAETLDDIDHVVGTGGTLQNRHFRRHALLHARIRYRTDRAGRAIGLARRLRLAGQRRSHRSDAGNAGAFQETAPTEFGWIASIGHFSLPILRTFADSLRQARRRWKSQCDELTRLTNARAPFSLAGHRFAVNLGPRMAAFRVRAGATPLELRFRWRANR